MYRGEAPLLYYRTEAQFFLHGILHVFITCSIRLYWSENDIMQASVYVFIITSSGMIGYCSLERRIQS